MAKMSTARNALENVYGRCYRQKIVVVHSDRDGREPFSRTLIKTVKKSKIKHYHCFTTTKNKEQNTNT